MIIILCLALTLPATLTVYTLSRRRRKRRRTMPAPMARAFPSRVLRELDEHLEDIARHEVRRIERDVERYLTGAVGYVVTTHGSPDGIALQLSDGRRLALVGVSRHNRQLLVLQTATDLLQPTQVHRDVFTYRLRLRSQAGTDIDVHARTIVLAV